MCTVVTLVQMVAALGPALVPVNDAARAPVEIGGIHISELADPTPYMEGGEALLTTGIPFTGTPVDAGEFVDRVRAHGIVALVIGLGPQLDEVPPALVAQADRAGLPLLVVPADQLFVRVTRGYWDLVAASGRAALVAQLGTQTALVREAGKPDGVAGVVSLVAQSVGGWAAYVPLHGGEPVVWPATQAGVLPGLQPEVRRFAERGNVGAATFPLHGYDVIAHPVGSGAQVRGALCVGVGRRPSPADRQLILTAMAVLGLRERAQGDAASLTRSIGEAIVDLLVAGEAQAAQALIRSTGGPALPSTVRVLAFPLPEEQRGRGIAAASLEAMIGELTHRGLLSTAAAARSRPPRASTTGGVGVLLLSGPQDADPPDPPRRPTRPDARSSSDPPAGSGASTGSAEIVGPDTAGASTAGTASAGTPVGVLTGALSDPVRPAELSGILPIAIRRARDAAPGEVVPAGPAAGLDEGELAAERLAAYRRAPLLETARSYLRHRGSWEAAARELGVHRNTIRNRVRIIVDELGIDLDDPDLSAELWIALRTRP